MVAAVEEREGSAAAVPWTRVLRAGSGVEVVCAHEYSAGSCRFGGRDDTVLTQLGRPQGTRHGAPVLLVRQCDLGENDACLGCQGLAEVTGIGIETDGGASVRS